MDFSEKLIGGAILIVVAATMWFNLTPAATLNGKELIDPKTQFHVVRHGDQVDGTVEVTHVASGDKFTADVSSGQFYQTPDQADSDKWSTRVLRDRYLIDPGFDIGTFAGAYMGGSTENHDGMAVGIRYSPVRLLYGTTAPDLLIGQDGAGVGLSLYPPPDYFGHNWSHFGIGFGRLWDYQGGDSDNILYGSFTTRF
jgi:hypothetical protein